MGFFKEVASTWSYKRKASVTPDEFIEALRSDLGRVPDYESVQFFRDHPDTVNILHKILTGKLKSSGDRKKDGLVIDFVWEEMASLLPTKSHLSLDSMVDIMDQFSETYKDAGGIISHVFVMFLRK